MFGHLNVPVKGFGLLLLEANLRQLLSYFADSYVILRLLQWFSILRRSSLLLHISGRRIIFNTAILYKWIQKSIFIGKSREQFLGAFIIIRENDIRLEESFMHPYSDIVAIVSLINIFVTCLGTDVDFSFFRIEHLIILAWIYPVWIWSLLLRINSQTFWKIEILECWLIAFVE